MNSFSSVLTWGLFILSVTDMQQWSDNSVNGRTEKEKISSIREDQPKA